MDNQEYLIKWLESRLKEVKKEHKTAKRDTNWFDLIEAEAIIHFIEKNLWLIDTEPYKGDL